MRQHSTVAHHYSKIMEEVPDNFTNLTDRINCLMKELMELKEMISKYKMERDYWELQCTALSTSIWAGEIKYTEQQKMEAHLRTTVIESNKLIESKEQELKNLIAKRTTYFSEQCDKFRIRNTKSADNILSAQKEYSTENLLKDIKQYCEEDEKTNKELEALRNKLTKLETDCDFNCLNLGQENDEILQINNVLSDLMENNNIKLLKIKLAQDTLKKLKNEIKQKKMLINSFNE